MADLMQPCIGGEKWHSGSTGEHKSTHPKRWSWTSRCRWRSRVVVWGSAPVAPTDTSTCTTSCCSSWTPSSCTTISRVSCRSQMDLGRMWHVELQQITFHKDLFISSTNYVNSVELSGLHFDIVSLSQSNGTMLLQSKMYNWIPCPTTWSSTTQPNALIMLHKSLHSTCLCTCITSFFFLIRMQSGEA